jgi:hypothetical protein
MMSSIINVTGEITGLTDTLKKLLEKQLKINNDLIINDSQKLKQLSIPISKDKMDIFHGVHNSILYIYLFQSTKKLQIEQSTESQSKKLETPILINYRDSANYNIMLANKGIASISKNVKKNKLELVSRINDGLILYKFAGKYLFAVDSNGFLYYYPDSIDIQSLESWKNNKIEDTQPLDKYMLLNKYVLLECYLADTAYSLEDVTKTCLNQSPASLASLASHQESKSIALKDNDYNNYNNTLLDENKKQNQQNPQAHNSNIAISPSHTEYSTLGYLLSWLNPLSYYSSNTNTTTSNTSTSNTSNTSNTSSLLSISKSDIKESLANGEREIPNRDAIYYIDTSTSEFDIVKISRSTNTIKTLKSHKIYIPAFITDISINNLDEVILDGRIESQTITMKFNKYLINMQV